MGNLECVDCGTHVTVTPRAPAEPRCPRCNNYLLVKREVLKRRKQVADLKAELHTLRADKERLDWLEADAPRYDHDPEARIERVRALWWDGRPSFKARAAIDAAKEKT